MSKFIGSLLGAAILSAVPALAQAPFNNEPVGALAIGPGANSGLGFSTVGATPTPNTGGLQAPGCGAPDEDVWFTYTASVTGAHLIHTCPTAGQAPGSLRDTVLSVYGSTLTTVLGCNDDSVALQAPDASGYMSLVTLSFTAGTTYYLRVAGYTGQVAGTFYLNVIDASLNPNGGTDCVSALPISDGTFYGQLFGDVASGSVVGGCASFTATTLDIWYSYTAPISGDVNIFVEGVTATIFRMTAYDLTAGCGLETLVAGTCITTRNTRFAATVGTTYAFRIGVTTAAATDLAGIFSISVATIAPTLNDTCLTAQPLVDGDNLMTNVGATAEPALTVTCATGLFTAASNLDVWGFYTTAAAGRIVFNCRGIGTQQFVVYTGVCGALTTVGCSVGTAGVTVIDSVGGTTYYIRGGGTVANNVSALNFDVTFTAFPANDECAGALPLITGLNAGLSNAGATTSVGASSCTAQFNDVWYAWTAPISATIKISGCGSSSDPVFTLYGSCGGVELACDDDDLLNLGPCATTQTLMPYIQIAVTAGTTYFLRVGNNTAVDMSFSVNLEYQFSLVLSYDPMAFAVTIADVAGNPGDLALNVITLNQGAYPNGYFYGVDIPIFELTGLLYSGAPFFVLLDGTGSYSLTIGGIPPLGLTFYAVGVDYTPAGIFSKKSAPTSLTI